MDANKTIKKDLFIQSRDLGEDVQIMLCFTPSHDCNWNKQFPVAWKVKKFNATGPSGLHATYTHALGVCSVKVTGPKGIVDPVEHMPLSPGEQSTLEKNGENYTWTPPEYIGGTAISSKNGTEAPVDTGVGFITNKGTINEAITPTAVFDGLEPLAEANVEFEPVLNIYVVGLDWQEKQIIKGEIDCIDPIWKKNLLSLKPQTTIEVYKNAWGQYEAKIIYDNITEGFNVSSFRGLDYAFGAAVMYRATLSFAYAGDVNRIMDAAMCALIYRHYRVKAVVQDGEQEARIELELPPSKSCFDAEEALLDVMPKYPFCRSGVAIKERSGEILKFKAGNWDNWTKINPASYDWNRPFSIAANMDIAGKTGVTVQVNGDVHEN